MSEGEHVRLDRWLNAARFYKTRSRAAEACRGRKVKVNGTTAKPHKFIRIGDRLTVFHHGNYRSLEVTGLAERGLPAKEAQLLYSEEKPQDAFGGEDLELITIFKKTHTLRPRYKGRPTKKERRKMTAEKNLFGKEQGS